MAIAVALVPSAANAEGRWFEDRQGEIHSSVDIHRVRVLNGTVLQPGVKVAVVQRELRAGDGFDVWLNTVAADPGPEYVVAWVANSDSLGVRRVDAFGDAGQAVACPGLRVRSAQDDVGETSFANVPRRCLGFPGAVQVSVQAVRQLGHTLATDWAPAVRQFYPWVARGLPL